MKQINQNALKKIKKECTRQVGLKMKQMKDLTMCVPLNVLFPSPEMVGGNAVPPCSQARFYFTHAGKTMRDEWS